MLSATRHRGKIPVLDDPQLARIAILERAETGGPDECWLWRGPFQRGYGLCGLRASRGSTPKRAHRVSYELFVRPIPSDRQLHHTCGNRACVNPEHVREITPQEHGHISSPRRTHCRRGHELTADNIHIDRTTGFRRCLICHKAQIRRKWILKRERQRAAA